MLAPGSGRRRGGPTTAESIALFLCGVAWLFAAGHGLGSYPLIEPDEGRNAEVARWMAAGGDWILPQYNALPYLDKPPLWFHTAAAAMTLLGPSEFAARLPSLGFTLATVLLVGWFGGRLYGRQQGRVAAVMLATSPMVLACARIAIFDAMLVGLMVAALVAAHEAIEGEAHGAPGASGRPWAALLWLAMGLGVLTKGPVALAVPLLVALPYAIWRRRVQRLWSWGGLAMFLAIVLPWIVAVEERVPGFLRYVATIETWGRLTTEALGPASPAWYLVACLIGGALPWAAAAAAAWTGRDGERCAAGVDRRLVFLGLWLLAPLAPLWLAQPTRPHYVLPLIPAVALLLAARWEHPLAGARARLAGGACLLALALLFGLLSAGALPAARRLPATLLAPAQAAALALAILAAIGGTLAIAWRARPRLALLALAVPPLLLPVVTFPLLREVAARRSSKALAASIETECPGAEVVGIDVLPTSLPFYLGRSVGLASVSGEPFPSTYVRRGWARLPSSWRERGIFTVSPWPRLPPRAVVILEPWQQGRTLKAQTLGFQPLVDDGRRVALGRRCAETP